MIRTMSVRHLSRVPLAVCVLLTVASRAGGADCNGNAMEDRLEIDNGVSEDCNRNGIPDDCDRAPLELLLGGQSFPLPDNPRATAAVDFDGDGLIDLVMALGDSIAVLRSRGDGTFDAAVTFASTGTPRALTVADLDGDGATDVVTANSTFLAILKNSGKGELLPPVSVEVPSTTRYVTAADVTGDTKLDLVATNSRGDVVLVLPQLADGSFGQPQSFAVGDSPNAVAAADFDGDGDVDLAVSNRNSEDVTVLDNRGGDFVATSRLEARGSDPFFVVAVDFDGDDAPDLAAATATGVSVWLNTGGGIFGDVSVHESVPSSLSAADVDGDGDLDLIYGSFGTNVLEVLENLGNGRFDAGTVLPVAFKRGVPIPGDFDGDGDGDIAITHLGFDGITVLWNREPGRAGLTFKTAEALVDVRPHGIGMGDLNGDGFPDVITANGHFDSISVFMSNGDGSFAPRVDYREQGVGHFNDVEAVDLDGDADIDLAVVDQDSSRLHIFANNGDGTLQTVARFRNDNRPWTVTSGDFDGDGDADLVTANRGASTVQFHFNDGNGEFPQQLSVRVGLDPVALAAGDVDGDGDLDLVVANSGSGDISVLQNNGDGTFPRPRAQPVRGSPLGITLGDYDGDGDLDVATTNTFRVEVATHRGDGTFVFGASYEIPVPTYTISTTDIDGDGFGDLVAVSLERNSVAILLGKGDGTFRPPILQLVGQQPLAVAMGDLDQDGDIDLVTPNRGSHDVTTLLNQSARPVFEEDYLETICTGLDFFKVSVAARVDEVERVCKFVVPAREGPDLLPAVFQNTRRFVLHQQFLAAVFPERFPGLTVQEYDRLVSRRETRSYFAGSISRFRLPPSTDGGGTVYGFSIAADDIPDLAEARYVHEALSATFQLSPLGYFPDTTTAREAARAWPDPGFLVYLEGGESRRGYQAYTVGVSYGRVRRLEASDFETANASGQFSFQNILVLEESPRDIEGVVGGVITAEPQSELSHLAVRTARRKTPNAFVAGALEAFAPLEGELIRLEVGETSYAARVATVEEAREFWATNRPELPSIPALDPDFSELASLAEIAALERSDTDIPQESRFGGKATNLARLGQVLAAGPFASLRERGFAIPVHYYLDFMVSAGNRIPSAFDPGRALSYEAYLNELMASAAFVSDPVFRFEALAEFRSHVRENGIVSPVLVQAIAFRIAEIFQSTRSEVRFRSSSNIEDLLEFNGAGLYESTGACAADDLDGNDFGPSSCNRSRPGERGIARALKKVWSSLWTFRAYEERAFFGISQEAAGMGVLVSRSFPDEQANGVAFTGNIANPLDERYVVTVQAGEESVVSPSPQVFAEKDVLEIVDGRVARIIRPERGSSLVPPGTWVLSDERLRELGSLMAYVDENFPVETGEFRRDQILLDMEFKVEKSGELALKQVRPFLLTVSPPPAPTFELVIAAGTVACGVFSEAGADRGPREEYELKSTVRFRGGTVSLPTRTDTFTEDIIEEVRFGPGREVATPLSRGLFRIVRFPGGGDVIRYRFRYEQEFGLRDGRRLVIRFSPSAVRARGEEPVDPPLVLDDEALTTFVGEEVVLGWLDGEPRVHYGWCRSSTLPRWEVTVQLEDGTALHMEERFLSPGTVAKTGPAGLERAEVVHGARRRLVVDYWRLVYSAFRHNTAVRYWIVFDEPFDIPGVDGEVYAVEFAAADEFEGTPATAAYLGSDFSILAHRAVASLRRRPAAVVTRFRRGDADASGETNLTDALVILQHLFGGRAEPACLKSADTDDSGHISLTDGIHLLSYLFRGGPPPPVPSEDCGEDPTTDDLSCASHPACR